MAHSDRFTYRREDHYVSYKMVSIQFGGCPAEATDQSESHPGSYGERSELGSCPEADVLLPCNYISQWSALLP